MNLDEVTIWNQTRGRLMNFVLRYTQDRPLAEGIVQDVFLKVHDKLPQLTQSDKISSWIFRIARNAITDHFRRKSRTISAMDLDWGPDVVTLNDCVTSCLGEMLKTLPEKYRRALELAELEGMSQLELAEGLLFPTPAPSLACRERAGYSKKRWMLPTVFNSTDTATLLHARTSSLVDVVKESKDIPCSLSC